MPHLLLITLGVLAAGCDQSSPSPTTQPAAKKAGTVIAFVGAGENDPLWPILRTSAADYAQQFGKHEVKFLSAPGNSPQEQLKLLDSLEDVRGLCIAVTDLQVIRGALEKKLRAGTLLVSMMRPIPDEMRVGHVGLDQEEIGRVLADTAAKALDSKGSIMLLHAGEQHPIFGPRLTAFRKQMTHYPFVEVFAEVNGEDDTQRCLELMRERSERYPRLSAWVALDNWPVRYGANLDDVLPSNCKVITFGGMPAEWPLLRSGRMPAAVTANYRELGSKAVQFLEAAMRANSAFARRYDAPLRVVWGSNLDEYIRDWGFWTTGAYETESLTK